MLSLGHQFSQRRGWAIWEVNTPTSFKTTPTLSVSHSEGAVAEGRGHRLRRSATLDDSHGLQGRLACRILEVTSIGEWPTAGARVTKGAWYVMAEPGDTSLKKLGSSLETARIKCAEPVNRTRIVWAPLILLVVGWYAADGFRSDSDQSGFYSTSAQVIVTLYVAVVIDLVGAAPHGNHQTQESGNPLAGRMLTHEHWLFLLISSGGLLASLRALVDPSALLFGLTSAGVAATILLVAESLIHHHGTGNWRAPFWSVPFVGILALIVLWR